MRQIEAQAHGLADALEKQGEKSAAHIIRTLLGERTQMVAVLKQIETEMRAGLGSSYGETREAVRRAINLTV